jgi:hypothetical protein
MTQEKCHLIVNLALAREQEGFESIKKLYKLENVNYDQPIKSSGKDYLIQDWTARDYLSDVVYWHENFASTIEALALDKAPKLIKLSLRDATKEAVGANKDQTVAQLLRRLTRAQTTIEKLIFSDELDMIPYRKGSKYYTATEYLDIRTSEFKWHFWAVVQGLLGKTKDQEENK